MGEPAERLGLWLYGVLDADAAEPGEWLGVDGRHGVRRVRRGRLCALVSAVPLPEFGAEMLHAALEDLDRLSALARAHEDVLDRALGLGAVVPFRICTIYESEASLEAMLEERQDQLKTTLRRLRGVAEWGVKAFLTGAAAAAQGTRPAERTEPVSGADYLTRKRLARDEAERSRDAVEDTVAGIHALLGEQAVATALERAHDRRLSGRDEEMVLNASYLVPDDRLDGFRELVAELAARHREAGFEIELTGPWPPYHFVAESESAA